MFENLLDLVRPIRLNDTVFGLVRYQRVGFWEARTHFPPVSTAVEVLLDGDRTGPTTDQHAFFRSLQERYATLLSSVTAAIEAERAKQSAPLANVPTPQFHLVCIDLPQHPSDTCTWELSFEDERGFHYVVAFQGWQVSDVAAEE